MTENFPRGSSPAFRLWYLYMKQANQSKDNQSLHSFLYFNSFLILKRNSKAATGVAL